MRKSLAFIIALVAVVSFSSCSREQRYATLENVKIVDSFPKEYPLSRPEALDLDLMGVVEVKTYGDLTIYLTPQDTTLWKLAATSDHVITGRALQKGTGPNEFTRLPSIIDVNQTADTATILVKDSHSKKFYNVVVNLQAPELDDVTVLEVEDSPYAAYAKNERYIIPMSDSLTFICKYDASGKGFDRKVLAGGELNVIPNMGTLQGDFSELKDLNTLAFVPVTNPEGTEVAELMTRVNQINLYSLSDAAKRTTICVGSQVEDINEVDSRSRADRVGRYKAGEAFPGYFAALYSGQSDKDIDAGKGSSQLQFFDWNGNPLMLVTLDEAITTFHIDAAGNIYGFSPYGASETIYKWNAADILGDILK